MKLSELIKVILIKENLTLTELSTKTKIPKSTLHGWLCGVKDSDYIKIKALLEIPRAK